MSLVKLEYHDQDRQRKGLGPVELDVKKHDASNEQITVKTQAGASFEPTPKSPLPGKVLLKKGTSKS